MRYAGVVLLVVASTGCLYTPPKLPKAEPCDTCNHSPVAVIRGAPDVVVGSDAWVYLDGSSSTDPDGDLLTYAWTISGGCAETFNSEVHGDAYHFWSMPADVATPCDATLTVSDGVSSTTTTATVTVADVQAYVSDDSTTCEAFANDPTTDLRRGNAGAPWCKLEDGVAAAVAYSIADVFVAKGVYWPGHLAIPSRVFVQGGFDRNFEKFDGDPAYNADIIVEPPVGITFKPGTEQWLQAANVTFGSPCTGECTLILGRSSWFTLDACSLGATSEGTVTTVGPGATFVAVAASGEEFEANLSATTIKLPMSGQSLTGALFESNDHGRAFLSRVEIGGNLNGPAFAVGVHSRRLETLEVGDASLISMTADGVLGDTGTTIAGIMDGDRLGMNDCAAPACNASTSVYVFNSSVLANNPRGNAYGVAFFGTADGDVFAADAGAAVSVVASGSGIVAGVHSVKAGGVWVANESGESAVVTADGGTTGRLTAALLDGLVDPGVVPFPSPVAESGSHNLVVSNARLEVVVPMVDVASDQPAMAAAAALLAGTTESSIENHAALVVNAASWCESTTERAPTYVAGLWTLDTTDVTVTGSTFSGPADGWVPPTANDVLAGVLDGAFDPATGAVRLPSTWLSLWSSSVTMTLNTPPLPALAGGAAGVLLVGSHAFDVGRDPDDSAAHPSSVACDVSSDSPDRVFHNLWTLGTDGGRVHHTNTGAPPTYPVTLAFRSATLIDLRDGRASFAVQNGGPTLVSTDLELDDNWISFADSPVFQDHTGLWLDHDPAYPLDPGRATRVYNNAVFPRPLPSNSAGMTAEAHSTGVELDFAVASVFNNTIHAGRCDPGGVYGTCYYLRTTTGLHLAGKPGAPLTTVDNNLIHGGDGATFAAAVVDNAATQDSATTLYHPNAVSFMGNLLLGKRTYDVSSVYWYLSLTTADNTTLSVGVPEDATAWLNYGSVGLDSGAWPFCPDDLHIDPHTTAVTALGYIRDQAYLDDVPLQDIDGVVRLTGAPNDQADVGADEIDVECR